MCTTTLRYMATYSMLLSKTKLPSDTKSAYAVHMYGHKYSAGIFEPSINAILINLETHAKMWGNMLNEYDFINLICITITHESLHWVFHNEIGFSDPQDSIENIVDELSRR